MGAHHKYTEEQLSFLESHYENMKRQELTDAFNEKFGTNYHRTTIINLCNRNGWRAKADGRFTSETSPRWQKGLSKDEFKSHYSDESFNRMTKPMIEGAREHHVGDVIIRHGIPQVIVSEDPRVGLDKRIIAKARYVYEQKYGKLPTRDMIIHLDGDVMNCDIDNLIRVKQKWRAEFIHNGWWHAPAEILKAAVKYCELRDAIKGASV